MYSIGTDWRIFYVHEEIKSDISYTWKKHAEQFTFLNEYLFLKKRPYFKTICHINYVQQGLLQRHENIDFIFYAYVHDKNFPIHDT